MLGDMLIQEVCNVRSTKKSNHPLRWILLANAGVALITSSAALVVLLIAPLGMAAVLTCTGLVAVLSFVLGVVADLVLWHGLIPGRKGTTTSNSADWERADPRVGLPPSTGSKTLPLRHQR
jgi:hypothetical protein